MFLESETLFRQLAEHSLVGIYIIQNGRYVYANPKLAETFGYTVEEILELEDWLELIALPDRPLVAEQVRRRLEGEAKTDRYAFRGLHRNGTIFDVEVYGSVTEVNGRPAALGNLIDITERGLAQSALRESEELFRRAFEDTHLAMVLTDLDHRFIRVNTAFAQMFGYSPAEMLGMTMGEITHPDFLAESYARREPLLAGESTYFQMEKKYLHRSGEVLTALANVSLVCDANGRPRLFVGQVLDITDRKRLEEQAHQSQKMEAIGVLAGGVAHDFNNLLTVINGYCEFVLGDQSLTPTSKEMIREIHRAGDQAAALTRQLLAFSRKQILAPRALDVNVLLGETSRMLRRLIDENIDLASVFDPFLWRVKADPGQIEQVVMNLVINARDAMPRGGKLTIETHNIELSEDYSRKHLGVSPGSYVLLAVTDTGIGMEAGTVSRIFEPFYTTKDPGKGTGLGLATVHGIVRQSGGHIEVYSEPGQGTTFKVYLPRLRGESVFDVPAIDSEVAGGREFILLAEDDEGIRSLARLALQSRGYQLVEAADGEKALVLGSSNPTPIQLLITDVVMPKLGGRELAVRLQEVHPEMRVLYISGYTDDAIVRHGVVDEGVAFLHKPFTPSTLARKVREVLDSRQSRFW